MKNMVDSQHLFYYNIHLRDNPCANGLALDSRGGQHSLDSLDTYLWYISFIVFTF